MTVKLVMLKSGENVISDIQEIIMEEKVVGYLFNKPQIVLLKNFDAGSKNIQERISHSFDINLFPWILLTEDDQIAIPTEWVVTLVNPVEKLKTMYQQKVLNSNQEEEKLNEPNQDIVFTEQSDSDQSD
jgi:hypothetical protein